MPKYTISYSIRLWGCIDIDAPSEEEAEEQFEDLTHADLIADADVADCTDIEVVDVTTDAPPLHQLAEQAE